MTDPRTGPARWSALAALLLFGATACGGGVDPAGVEHYLDLSDQPMAASEIELATVDGEPWGFTDVAEDRLTLLFFGYTSCPDVCPMTMAEIDLALDEAGDDADGFDVVMVSSDPVRDTDQQLRSWLDRFDPDFQGVRGDVDATVEAARDYGVPIEAPQETEGEYLVSHGGRILVLTPGGEAAGMFDEGVTADQIAPLLPALREELL
ncbi:SCO family protein [Nocardiopsis terrae]|uniref:Protein SCO1/2 n=1 Tax=Nocardiopsis terrae TaxID=372655 RepID=A0ABR9HH94_9ACTN|nr:SCO family protein [Nocardiopsis terrae]MBE1458190.1 protein SCO1/2 [Nocardiopsis terrae]GHC81727.1 SCO family protein [Nocardiopsis terrae]